MSPVLTKIGTFILIPVSKVTVFAPDWALSPLRLGGASTTFKLTLIGNKERCYGKGCHFRDCAVLE